MDLTSLAALRSGALMAGPLALFLLAGSARAGGATISALSDTIVSRSGRLVLHGSGFGSQPGSQALIVDGQPALTASWTDTRITTYMPETAALGDVSVLLQGPSGASNSLSLSVTPRVSQGRVAWRFQAADSALVKHRPAIGSDGTVYLNDSGGLVYALSPDGALKWIFNTQGQGADGPVSIASDDTLYVSSNPLGLGADIVAIRPEGTELWRFTDPDSQNITAGPNVGPDGKIYAVSEAPGIGALALTPAGQLAWSSGFYAEFGSLGQEIAQALRDLASFFPTR